MSWKERLGLVVSVSSLLISFLALAVSKDVVSIFKKTELVYSAEVVDLSKVSSDSGVLEVLTVRNLGAAASGRLILRVGLSGGVIPKYDVSSNEDIKSVDVKGEELRISLDRLSSESKVLVQMYSPKPFVYTLRSVDDDGVGDVALQSPSARISLLSVFLLSLVFASMLAVVWVLKRLADGRVLMALGSHQIFVEDKLREIKEKVDGLEQLVSSVSDLNSGSSGELAAIDRLSKFLQRKE